MTTGLRDTIYSRVCYVVTQLHAIETGMYFYKDPVDYIGDPAGITSFRRLTHSFI
jgi:hypothetical protein